MVDGYPSFKDISTAGGLSYIISAEFGNTFVGWDPSLMEVKRDIVDSVSRGASKSSWLLTIVSLVSDVSI